MVCLNVFLPFSPFGCFPALGMLACFSALYCSVPVQEACKRFERGKTSTSAKREKTWNEHQVRENGEKKNQLLLRA